MPSHQGYQKVSSEPTAPFSSSSQNPVSSDLDMETGNKIPSTNSSQQLVPTDTESVSASIEDQDSPHRTRTSRDDLNTPTSISLSDWFTVGVLCFVNLINYMDRFTIAGVLTDIQDDFQIQDDKGGLLQTVFVISYMIFAPIFGYLGDRYSRKWIMALGILLWSGTTLLGSFMQDFWWFITFRALVGIGEASYSTIAPTIISDLFVSDVRSKMLALFYFAIPVGSGLGYIVGSETAHLVGTWRAALRVTPVLGVIAVILIFLTRDPPRGHSEGSHNLQATSYKEDIKALCKNPSFMLATGGFTCVAFVAGALSWWGPKFMHLGLTAGNDKNISLNEVSLIFGAISMTTGIIGVPLGSYLSQRLSKKNVRWDAYICAIGLLLSAPLVGAAMIVVTISAPAAYVLVFLGEIALNLNWAVVADITLYVVVPTRRSTAEAFQILISHTFGDAGSPYLVGVISEAIKNLLRVCAAGLTAFNGIPSLSQVAENATEIMEYVSPNCTTADDSVEMQFKALQYALFSTSFVEIIGGVFFLLTAIYILKDRQNAERAVADHQRNEASQQDGDNTTISSIE